MPQNVPSGGVQASQPFLSILLQKFSTLFSKIMYVWKYSVRVSKLLNWILLSKSCYDWTAHLHVKYINSLLQVKLLNISYLQTWLQIIVVDFTNWRLWDRSNIFAEIYCKKQNENIDVKYDFWSRVLIKIK